MRKGVLRKIFNNKFANTLVLPVKSSPESLGGQLM